MEDFFSAQNMEGSRFIKNKRSPGFGVRHDFIDFNGKSKYSTTHVSGENSPESLLGVFSSSESMSMAQDFLNSGSPPCDNASWAQLATRQRCGSFRAPSKTRPKYLIQEEWDLGEARPRVLSMPTRPSFHTRHNKDQLDDMHRVRNFAITSKGLVSQGDLFRKKPDSNASASSLDQGGSSLSSLRSRELTTPYRVGVIGSAGVGKKSLVSALIDNSDRDKDVSFDDDSEKSVSILLDGEESTMEFVDLSDRQIDDQIKNEHVSAYVVVYSVEDRRSYEAAINRLLEIREEVGDHVALILVANKTDLVRTRVVSEEEGRAAAKTYDSKYIEVSAAIDLKIDELLVGVLKQIRLFKQKYEKFKPRFANTILDSCCLLQARENVLSKLFKSGKPQSKSCDNLYVL